MTSLTEKSRTETHLGLTAKEVWLVVHRIARAFQGFKEFSRESLRFWFILEILHFMSVWGTNASSKTMNAPPIMVLS